MPRTTMNIPDEMLAEIDALAEEMFCSRSVALRVLYGHWKSDSTSPCIKVNQSDITVNHFGHPSPDPPTRAPAPPRGHDDQQRESISLSEDGREQRISDLLASLPWYGARLAQDSSPEQFAARLVEAFPAVDLAAELNKASAWLGESPKRRKKQLGSFLLGWMGRVGRGPAYKPRESTVQRQAKQQDFAPRGEWK